MSPLFVVPFRRRGINSLIVISAGLMLSGCYSCSLNGGWEGQMNPFCVEKASLGSVSGMDDYRDIKAGPPVRNQPRHLAYAGAAKPAQTTGLS